MPVTQTQQGQPPSHLFQPCEAEGRASGMAGESPGQQGRDGQVHCICSCVSEPRGNGWRLPSSSGVSAHTRLLVFGCPVWLPCSEPAEEPQEECVGVTALWRGSARARLCSTLLAWWRGFGGWHASRGACQHLFSSCPSGTSYE